MRAGNPIWLLTTKVPLQDTQGQIIGLVGMSHDITDLKQTEEALERQAARLALLNEVGGKIASVLELESVLNTAAHLVQESFGYHHVGLFTVDRERGELVMRARAGEFAHLFPSGPPDQAGPRPGRLGGRATASGCWPTMCAPSRATPTFILT